MDQQGIEALGFFVFRVTFEEKNMLKWREENV